MTPSPHRNAPTRAPNRLQCYSPKHYRQSPRNRNPKPKSIPTVHNSHKNSNAVTLLQALWKNGRRNRGESLAGEKRYGGVIVDARSSREAMDETSKSLTFKWKMPHPSLGTKTLNRKPGASTDTKWSKNKSGQSLRRQRKPGVSRLRSGLLWFSRCRKLKDFPFKLQLRLWSPTKKEGRYQNCSKPLNHRVLTSLLYSYKPTIIPPTKVATHEIKENAQQK